jgi:Carboxypeptidase regulatory-like domain
MNYQTPMFRSQRDMQHSSRVLWALLAVAILLGSAWGQTNQGSIAGNVTDPSGALMPGVKITATDIARGTTYETVSSSAGSYRFPNVNIGSYDITATATGFKTAHLTGVVVQVATTAALDIKLQTGTVSETVTVNANSPTVQTESADIGTVVSTKQTLDLPLALGSTVQAMRSPEAFVFLTPGAVGPGSDSGNGGTFESKISGGQNYATEVLLDGAGTTRSENGSSFDETAPSVEALGEFKVLTSTLPAEFGRTTGGIESFNTKSGTNAYHGNIYELFRNEDLDANVWGNNYNLANNIGPRSASQRPLDRQNDYGGTFGGPVRIPHLYNGTDKTFFFFSWEQYRQEQGGVTTSTVPTTDELGGNFSALLGAPVVDNMGHPILNPCDGTPIIQGQIFDPSTTRTASDGTLCRTAFPGNIIPGGFSTVGQTLLSYYPAPENGNLTNNYIFPFSFPILDTTTTFRIDQNITQKSKAYFTYSSRENVRISTTPEWANPAGYGRNQFFGTHYIRFGYDYTFTPTMLNHVNLGYNRTNSKNVGAGVALGKGTDWDQSLGITGGASGPMFPGINGAAANYGDNVDGDTIDNGFRFSDTLNWVHGKHEFKFGYEQWYQQYSPLNFQNTSGTFNFGNGQTAVTPALANQTGNGIASLLLGLPQSANYTVYDSQARWLRSYFAGFVQDSFKVTPTFTLNLGLRYEIDQPFKEAYDDSSNISLTAPNPAAGGLPGALVFAGKGAGRNGVTNERWAETYKKAFGPRVGFAWAPSFLGGKTVFRGGYGIIYGGLQYADFGGYSRNGFQANPGFSSLNGFTPAFNLDSGLPAANVTLPNFDPSQVNFQGCCAETYIDKSYGRQPMIQNWSAEVQHELAKDLILDLAYVGQHSTHLRSNFDAVNSLTPNYFSLGTVLTADINSPQAAAAGVTPPYAGFGGIVAQALVPYPMFFGLNTDGQLENLGQSTYNALEAQLTRRFHNGLNLMASYTWSKTLTDADAALPYFATLHQGGAAQNPFNLRGDKSLSNQDLPQNFVVSYIYELPFGKNKKFLSRGGVVDRIVGGWSVSGIQRYESGQPIAFGCATGVPAFAGCIRFDQVPGSSLLSPQWRSGHFNPVTDSMFNPVDTSLLPDAAFHDPNASLTAGQAYSFGTLPRVDGAVRMGPYLSEDFNLLKRTKISEKSDILLQVSFLNAFNRHVWNRPEDVGPGDSSRLNPVTGQIVPGNFGVIQYDNFSNAGGGSYLLLPRKIQLQLKFEF